MMGRAADWAITRRFRRGGFGCRWRRMVMSWIYFGLISAGAAAATAILGKVGVQGIPSNLATAFRTLVVLGFAWSLVLLHGEVGAIKDLRGRTLLFLILSGVATGISWLAYYRALQLAPASRVAVLDRLSLPLTLLLAWGFLGEPLTLRMGLGMVLMVSGALLAAS